MAFVSSQHCSPLLTTGRLLLVLGAWTLFLGALLLPGVRANPLGAWGTEQSYRTVWVLGFRSMYPLFYLSDSSPDSGDGYRALAGLAFAAGMIYFLAVPFLMMFNKGNFPALPKLVSVCLLSPWLFPLIRWGMGFGAVDLIGFYLLAISFALAFAAVQMPVECARPRFTRVGSAHCASCGYDLRSSKGRCPECGTPIQDSVGSLFSVLKR
jgi:hypothetical protein